MMRRALAAIGCAATLLLAGCTAAPGGDRLVRDWPMPPEPVEYVPQAGQCFTSVYAEVITTADRRPVDCATKHYGEVVYVGRFTGPAAALPEPPRLTPDAAAGPAAAQRMAYETCAKESETYLNHAWYDPNLRLRVALPYDKAWSSGARWFACELYEHGWGVGSDTIDLRRADSLTSRWMATVCVDQNTDDWPAVACSQRHPGEFVGGFELPATMTKEPKTAAEWDKLFERCFRLAAVYRGVSLSKARQMSGVSAWWIDDPELWPSGRRSALCFTWTGAKSASYVIGSVKGKHG